MKQSLEAVFAAAFATAIRNVGVTTFKRTSFFGSSWNVEKAEFKKAA